MDALLARLADPAPIAWILGSPVRRPGYLPQGVYAEILLDRQILLLGRDLHGGPLHLHTRRELRRVLSLLPAGAAAGPVSEDDLRRLETARQAGRAPDALARHALLLDVARLLLHRRGHGHGQISADGGLDAVVPAAAGGPFRARTPLPHLLPQDLLRAVLAPVLVHGQDGSLNPGTLFHVLLEAPRSAHAALDLEAQVQDAIRRLPRAWRARFSAVLAAA